MPLEIQRGENHEKPQSSPTAFRLLPGIPFPGCKGDGVYACAGRPELLAWKDRVLGKLEEAARLQFDEWSSKLT